LLILLVLHVSILAWVCADSTAAKKYIAASLIYAVARDKKPTSGKNKVAAKIKPKEPKLKNLRHKKSTR
jgi:hypothetical protein